MSRSRLFVSNHRFFDSQWPLKTEYGYFDKNYLSSHCEAIQKSSFSNSSSHIKSLSFVFILKFLCQAHDVRGYSTLSTNPDQIEIIRSNREFLGSLLKPTRKLDILTLKDFLAQKIHFSVENNISCRKSVHRKVTKRTDLSQLFGLFYRCLSLMCRNVTILNCPKILS